MSKAFFSEIRKQSSGSFVSDELCDEAVGGGAVEVAEVVDGERQVDVANVFGGNDENFRSHLEVDDGTRNRRCLLVHLSIHLIRRTFELFAGVNL